MFKVVIMIGLPGSGKSTYCNRELAGECEVISLDVVKTRKREQALFEACLREKRSCVIDNTNVMKSERARYIPAAHAAGAKVVGILFPPDEKGCLARNALREGKKRVPDFVISKKLALYERPTLDEGFDELHEVVLQYGDD